MTKKPMPITARRSINIKKDFGGLTVFNRGGR